MNQRWTTALVASVLALAVSAGGCRIEQRPPRREERPMEIRMPPEPHAVPLRGLE